MSSKKALKPVDKAKQATIKLGCPTRNKSG